MNPSQGLIMRTSSIISIALLSLGLILPAGARTLVDAPPPPEVQEAPAEQNDAPPRPVTPEPPMRGQLLYEDHCTSCHESIVHVRENHRARSQAELRERVTNWAEYLKLRWDREDIEDVVNYLNSRFYQFER